MAEILMLIEQYITANYKAICYLSYLIMENGRINQQSKTLVIYFSSMNFLIEIEWDEIETFYLENNFEETIDFLDATIEHCCMMQYFYR